tara:strand:- start:451 stop:633 length:183 start_codon:yes stop_codon:yes gene_type:complete
MKVAALGLLMCALGATKFTVVQRSAPLDCHIDQPTTDSASNTNIRAEILFIFSFFSERAQ